jgi:acetyl esterase/lipase
MQNMFSSISMVGDYRLFRIFPFAHGSIGGGYAMDGDPNHLNFQYSVHKDLAAAGKSVAWLFVAYSLTSNRTYPTQIREGIEGLNYVLEEKQRSPSKIIVGGDSAGAAIALAILSHLSHPSPDFPDLKMDKKFKAVVIIAPWVSFRTDWPSFERNEFKDCISITKENEWSALYKGERLGSNYIEAALAPADWWEGARTQQLLCTAGGDEILLDPISEFVNKYKVSVVHFYLVKQDEKD